MDFRSPSFLTFRVQDLERSLCFYRDVLHVPLKLRVGKMAELQTESLLLVLRETSPPPATAEAMSWPSLGFEVDDLDAASAALVALGVELGAVEELEGGGQRRRFQDPDGHPLELISTRVC